MAKACSLEWTQYMSYYNEIKRCAQIVDSILSPILINIIGRAYASA